MQEQSSRPVGAGLSIRVDPDAAEPPFDQVRAQVAALVAQGRLLPGDRLPTVRGLATELGLAANTVARAYKELAAAGLIETGRRAGTTVASGEHAATVGLSVMATTFAAAARDAGLTDGAALALVREALRGR